MGNTESRITHMTKNIMMSGLMQIVKIVMSFVSRSVFIHVLNVEYLGISGLFQNVLSLLSMADMGFGAAIIYSMYKPVAEGDIEQQTALMNYYKNIYTTIALVVTGLGLAVIPFLPYIINLDQNIPHLTLYYLLYLANTVTTYLFVYKTSITIAHQKSYLIDGYQIAVNIGQTAVQIVILLVFHNFAAFLFVQMAGTLLTNAIKGHISEKMYPYIRNKGQLDEASQKKIKVNAGSMFIYKIAGAILSSTDNILISVLVGTVWVGYYYNYTLVINNVTNFIIIIFASITASVGNFNASQSKQRQYEAFSTLQLVSWWLFSICSICFCVLLQDFVTIWGNMMSQTILLDNTTFVAIMLSFYLPGTTRAVGTFRDTTGIFRDTKYVILLTSLLNLVFSVIFGRIWGMAGILFATSLARLLTNVWYEPVVIMKKYFGMPVALYFKQYIHFWLVFAGGLGSAWFLAQLLHVNWWINFLYKMVVCIVVPNLLFVLVFRDSREFQFVVNKLPFKKLNLLILGKRLKTMEIRTIGCTERGDCANQPDNPAGAPFTSGIASPVSLGRVKEQCCGCGMCAAGCPTGAIEMIADQEGFLYPQINVVACNGCGRCVQSCVYKHPVPAKESLMLAYAMENIDEEQRRISSSGGIFSALAQEFLQKGDTVVAPKFDSHFQLQHYLLEEIREIADYAGSKYTQSRIDHLYGVLQKKLLAGEIVLFSGTPCQIQGLKGYLKTDYDNLYTQDLICHGCASVTVFHQYLRYLERIHQSDIHSFNFRNKDSGWMGFGVQATFANEKKFTQRHSQNIHFKLFLGNYTLRPACYACIFRKQSRASDLTLGDFWNLKEHDDKGTSLVLVHTQKGKALLDMLEGKVRAYPVDFAESVALNKAYSSDMTRPEKRLMLMAEDFYDFRQIERRYFHVSFLQKVIRKLRRMMRKK